MERLSRKITIIDAKNQTLLESLKELWQYRELLYMLSLRRISVRYKQTVIGVVWVLLQPLMAMTIFSIIFGKLAKLPSDGIPYPLFAYSALVIWGLFSEGVTRSGSSLLQDAQLITKVYFPRLIIPLSAVVSACIDFVISLFLLLPLSYFYGLRPTWSLLLIPLVMLMTIILASGIGMILGSLSVRYRDFQHIVPFLMQVWLYCSPVVFSLEIVPRSLLFWFYLNPMTGLINLFRFAVTGETVFNLNGIIWSMSVSCLIFLLGTIVFRSVEDSFADFI